MQERMDGSRMCLLSKYRSITPNRALATLELELSQLMTVDPQALQEAGGNGEMAPSASWLAFGD